MKPPGVTIGQVCNSTLDWSEQSNGIAYSTTCIPTDCFKLLPCDSYSVGPDGFMNYSDAIRDACKGELIGEGVYRQLAKQCADHSQRVKLSAIADVEMLTHQRLKPIVVRLGIVVLDTDWLPVVERRLKDLKPLAWREFIDNAWRDWPPYIARFEALNLLAPPYDRAAIQSLIDHEVALVEFVRQERSIGDSASSADPLYTYLGRQRN